MYISGQVAMYDMKETVEQALRDATWTENKFGKDATSKITGYQVVNADGQQVIDQAGTYSSYYGWESFDETDNWTEFYSNTTGSSYVTFDFGVGTVIDQLKVTLSGNVAWTKTKKIGIEGSNDNTTFTSLGTWDNIAWFDANDGGTLSGNLYEEPTKRFDFTNTTSYQYYKIVFYDTYGGHRHRVREIGLIEPFDPTTATEWDSIFTSAGTSGSDSIAIEVRPGNSKTVNANEIEIITGTGMDSANQYTITDYTRSELHLTKHNTSEDSSMLVNYEIEVNLDRLFIQTTTEPLAAYPATSVGYFGLMKRHSSEADSTGLVRMTGQGADTANGAYVARNKAATLNEKYSPLYLKHTYAPSVWGDNVFVSPVLLEGANEGIRGELDEVYVARTEGIVNGDIVTIGTQKFRAIIVSSYGYNMFPTNCVLFKVPDTVS